MHTIESVKVSKYLWRVFLLWLVLREEVVSAQRELHTTPSPIPLKFHENHRLVQWCVNGVDEPEFQVYPWSEFAPILQRRYHEPFLSNVRFKYSVTLRPVKIKAEADVRLGSSQILWQRAHFVFQAKERRLFRYNVKTSYNNSIIQGLLVQVNFAPLGVGIPAIAQFTHPKEFNCADCEQPIGIPIACRKRTYFHSMHPTILAYHHRMQIPTQEKDRRRSHCVNKKIPSQCILQGFEELEENSHLLRQNDTEKTKVYKWAEDALKDSVGKPHPEMAVDCKETKECEGLFKGWFREKCCVDPQGGLCMKKSNETLNATETTTVSPDEEPAKNISLLCPNRHYQTASGKPGHNATMYDEYSNIFQDPKGQSLDWPVWECKPFTTNVCRVPGYANKASVPWETREQLAEDHTVPQGVTTSLPPVDPFLPATQCCVGVAPAPNLRECPDPGSGKVRYGKVCPYADPTSTTVVKTECIPRVVLPYDKSTETEVPEPDYADCDNLVKSKYFEPANEIHGNMVWYFPPCHFSNRVRFQMLVVHDFSRGVYSIYESEDYFDLKLGASSNAQLNTHIPAPLFNGFPHECEAPSTPSVEGLFSRANQKMPFDYSRSYDECIQEQGDNINHQICIGSPTFTPVRTKKGATTTDTKFPKCDESLVPEGLNYRPPPCADRCPLLPSTTVEVETTTQWNPIKRSPHGAINIITNFCIMPICVFIARFYKETYNLQSFKGAKTWFWMHMVGSGGSTVLMYMGYFTAKNVDSTDIHVVYGDIYIICLAISYCTAWMRHKKRLVSAIVELLHSWCGYGCLLVALFCVNNAKKNGVPISDAVKFIVYIALASLTVFYLGMTIHICSMDKKFGMKPRRWHFPIVESRFEDLPVPGRKVRQFFLFTLLLVNLPLTISTLFL